MQWKFWSKNKDFRVKKNQHRYTISDRDRDPNEWTIKRYLKAFIYTIIALTIYYYIVKYFDIWAHS